MIIDFHTHIYPEKIAAKAVENIGAFYTIPMEGGGNSGDPILGTAEHLVQAEREAGIDAVVVFSAAQSPAQVESINNFIARSVESNRTLFHGFGTMHPDYPEPEAEIERMKGLGLQGLKLHPDMQQFNIDDKRMYRSYAACREQRLPIVFHTGDYRYPYSHPARLAQVLDDFPGLLTVAAHFGAWSLFDLAVEYFEQRFCYFDVSSSIPYLGRRRSKELIHLYGAERFLFGSDYPMWNPAQCLKEFLELDLSDTENERILSLNAASLLF
jgi:predicted TIM-barrel fold metal-dependent hydrolase